MSQSPLQLYMDPFATSCRALIALCHLLKDDLPIERVDISLRRGDHLSPAFREACPGGKVPTLVHGAFTLTEGPAIARYLCALANSNLAGETSEERARIDERLFWISSSLVGPFCHGLVYPLFIPHLQWPDPATASIAHDRALAETRSALNHLEGIIGDGGYLAGSGLTLADLFAAGVLSMGQMITFDLEPWPGVSRWMSALGGTSAWRSLEQELAARSAAEF